MTKEVDMSLMRSQIGSVCDNDRANSISQNAIIIVFGYSAIGGKLSLTDA